ncbi:ParB-like nuclease domain protein [Streptomyces phage Daubenski]|uniref:ParB-like nuclease domain protein n=1 Tax=Streptomyces phage Daubenski TaxID=2653725 RepID=A0A5Q2WEV0_9CAUD|nr:ParB-like nuclease domain protein [Streptomyces phage Daubenski]YP_010104979.1 ParB-like nuclease domain protein [Streptomyces phage Daubenski]QGH76322.1 ParB-like nuclease domain protein [Streptomyces phage Daubenski]QGH76520.1 ParB-like nuclease domain protein [Streptomyces phage Daubenski]
MAHRSPVHSSDSLLTTGPLRGPLVMSGPDRNWCLCMPVMSARLYNMRKLSVDAIVARADFADREEGQSTMDLFTQLFFEMSDEFIESCERDGIQMPINFQNGTVYNGQHRVVMAWILGHKTINAVSLGTIVRNTELPYSSEERNAA